MKIRVCYSTRLIRQPYAAWVLFPFMLFRGSKEEVDDRLFRHEMQHVYQVQRIGWWKFYASYLWLLYKHGYASHPYEVEARERETDKLTTVERYFKDE